MASRLLAAGKVVEKTLELAAEEDIESTGDMANVPSPVCQ